MKFTAKTVERCILHINQIVERESPHSAIAGLELATAALAGLLDVYAQPNEDNPSGMVDDPWELRKHFANALLTLPILKKKIRLTQ